MTAKEYYKSKFPEADSNILKDSFWELMQSYAEQYHQEQLREELMEFDIWDAKQLGCNDYNKEKSKEHINRFLKERRMI